MDFWIPGVWKSVSPLWKNLRGLPDMMSRGGHGKAHVVRGLREFYSINYFQMRTRGRGSKILKILWTSYLEAPLSGSVAAEPRLSRKSWHEIRLPPPPPQLLPYGQASEVARRLREAAFLLRSTLSQPSLMCCGLLKRPSAACTSRDLRN